MNPENSSKLSWTFHEVWRNCSCQYSTLGLGADDLSMYVLPPFLTQKGQNKKGKLMEVLLYLVVFSCENDPPETQVTHGEFEAAM